ncbi:GTP-binding protein [Lobulomyces angularis]|nr:GTP-binding protein [Lobulomyces angularis]
MFSPNPSRSSTYDYLFKLLIVGDSNTGKSSLLLRFCDDTFTPSFITTIGIDYKIKTIELDGKKIKLQIWDTAGQERFQNVTRAYYRSAMGVLVTYDVTDIKTFNNIDNWMRQIEKNTNGDLCRMLIGNKCDLLEEKHVSKEQGQRLADTYNIKFLETSAKSDIAVEEAFLTLAKEIKVRLIDSLDNDIKEKETVAAISLNSVGAAASKVMKNSCNC